MSTRTQPFARGATNSVSYAGDTGTRTLQTDAAQYVQDGDSGQTVFMAVPQGNGTFVMGAAAGNTGTGIISGSVQNASTWTPGDYTLAFTSPTDWKITDSSSAVLASGSNYVAGTAISFNGAQVSVSGAPAAGDSFSINRSRTEDIFKTIDSLISAVGSTPSTDASKAQFQNQMNSTLQQIDQADSNFLNVRTSVGSRLSMLQAVDSSRQDSATQLATSLTGLRNTDYAESVSRLSQQTLSLQAAQQSYAKIANLSLFDYIK
jgi:flagellar hook-associated protein 3 FlgL